MNNADLGITIQKFICDHFNIEIPVEAQEQFYSNYNEQYITDLNIEEAMVLLFLMVTMFLKMKAFQNQLLSQE